MSGASIGAGYLLGLFGVVLSGAVLPVVPTGAAVSIAAALAEQDNLVLIVLVVAVGAAGAYVSDLGTYAVLSLAGRRAAHGSGRVTRWLHQKRQGAAVDRGRRQLKDHELRTLLLSRLVPGGQLPVLVVAAVGDYPWRRYAVADIGAATLWSVLYAATGIAGRAVFPKPWEGAAAGVVLVLLVSLISHLWNRWSSSRTAQNSSASEGPAV